MKWSKNTVGKTIRSRGSARPPMAPFTPPPPPVSPYLRTTPSSTTASPPQKNVSHTSSPPAAPSHPPTWRLAHDSFGPVPSFVGPGPIQITTISAHLCTLPSFDTPFLHGSRRTFLSRQRLNLFLCQQNIYTEQKDKTSETEQTNKNHETSEFIYLLICYWFVELRVNVRVERINFTRFDDDSPQTDDMMRFTFAPPTAKKKTHTHTK
jgi:hypothetical protein